jgi:tRNA threonylcarbamoyladenosine biosynthesis protein TsaE
MEVIYNLVEIDNVCELILKNSKHKNLLFNGEMGAGKTTLISKIVKTLGSNDVVSSPTFAIINQYQIIDNQRINHFDFYRLKSEHEALDIGVEEYFYSNDYNFIEWSEKIPNLLPTKYSSIKIEKLDECVRKIVISNSN